MQPLSQRLKYNSMLQMKRLKNKKQTSRAVFEISLHHVKYQQCQLFFFLPCRVASLSQSQLSVLLPGWGLV
jgi:hypothetical protein